MEYSPSRLHTGTAAVKLATQTLKNLIIANLGDKIGFTESINWALRVIRFTIHTGLKVSLFELHHGTIPRIELTNIVTGNKIYFSEWKTMNVSVPPKETPIYIARKEQEI